MKRLKFLLAVSTCSFGILSLIGVVYAGSLSPSTSPAATSYTLTDIYTRLTTNAIAVLGNHIFSPSTSPAASLYTLTQIYDAIPTIEEDRVLSGTTLLGVGGTYDINTLTESIVKSGTSYGSGSTGTYSGYPGTVWVANGSGSGSTALNETNCTNAANWYWFEDGNGDGDTTDPEDGICVQATTVTSASWNGDDSTVERDNTYIAGYTCSGNFPDGTVATYSGTGAGVADTVWNNGDCALCQSDCYDGKKDLPDQDGYTRPKEASDGHNGPITPEVLKNWKGTRLPTSSDFFGFCGYKDGGSNYETSCSSDTTHGNYGQMMGRTDECIDLSNSSWEWLSEQHYYNSARISGDYACSYFNNSDVYNDYRFRAVFRP